MSLLTAAQNYVEESVRSAIDRTKRTVTEIARRAASGLRAGIDRTTGKTFFGLLGAGLLGVLSAIPYQLSVIEQQVDVPITVIVVQALILNGLIIGTAVFVGLSLKDRTGFSVFDPDRPMRTVPEILSNYRFPISAGVGIGVVLVVLDGLVFGPLTESTELATLASGTQSVGVGLLASIYGGVTEEILLRLGFMTLVVWTIAKRSRTPGKTPSRTGVWSGIVLTAVAFGLGHLPTTAMEVDLTPAVVARSLVLNGIPGLFFGYCYWQRDLTAAMVAHFSADLTLHVATPALS